MTSESARIAAEVLVTTDMRGVRTHGTRQLLGYVRHILGGGIDTKAEMQIVEEGHNWAIVDGQGGLGVVTAYKSMRLAMSKCRRHVVGVVAARNSNHFGAAGYYAMMCVKEDMIGLAMTNGDPTMCTPGGAARLLANNPIAYAVPAGCAPPLALDIALSAAAGVKIHQAARDRKLVPPGWIIDKKGNPTNNPGDFENGGAHIPIGGHKGFGLALMVEVLAGVMTGSGITNEVTSFVQNPQRPSNIGHFFMAIDVSAFMPPARFKARVDKLVNEIRACPRAAGVDRIYLPGEMEQEEEERAKVRGVLLDEATLSNLKTLARDLKFKKDGFECFLST